MEDIFLKFVNLSISAGWLVLAIIAARLLMKKAPRWIVCLLWAMVAIRLVFPFSIESALSLIPSAETVPHEFMYPGIPEIHTGVNSLNSVINPIISETLAPTPQVSANPSQILTAICSRLWLVGIAIMALYAAISYIRVRYKVRVSVKAEKGIYITDGIGTPFILGIIRPKIYLPSDMDEDSRKHVIAHEKAHLRRHDHIWKPLGFALLSVYWFNPLIWVAYILLCRDIELACDEKVIREMGAEDKKAYSNALLSCSVPRRMISACPLAFGEVGVKARIKSVLSYKKPAFWIIIAAVVASVIIAVCFLTDPVDENIPDTIKVVDNGSDLDGLSIDMISADLDGEYPYIEVRWKNKTAKSFTFGDPYYIYRKTDEGWKDCHPTEVYWNSIGYMLSPFDSAEKKYSLFHIDMTKEGTYRLEVDCFEDGKADVEYKLWIEFELSKGQPFDTVKQYKAKELVYDSIFSSFSFTVDMAPYWKVSHFSNALYLQEYYNYDIKWVGLSDMRETTLRKDNFDNRLSLGASFKEGYSLEKLKKENKRAWEAAFTGTNSAYDLYMLLEQKNGDMYMCMGRCGEATDNGLQNATFSYILKLSEMIVGSEELNIDRPMLVMDGKYYLDWNITYTELPDHAVYAGILTPEMAHNTGLEGARYFTVKDESYYFYVEHMIDGNVIYKMWSGTRTEADTQNVMMYICKDSNEKITSPQITLYPDTEKYMFSYSALSSHISMGTYERTEEKLTLREDGADNVYVFDVNGNNLYFDADNSTKLPKYKYSQNGEAKYPFEDGAHFQRVYSIPLDEEVINDIHSQPAEADIDGDGKTEALSIGPGPTSGINTFTITATENGIAEYFNIFVCHHSYSYFLVSENGTLYLRCEEFGAEAKVHFFEVGVVDGNITLTENDEKMAYWGEQGLTSSWFTRYEENSDKLVINNTTLTMNSGTIFCDNNDIYLPVVAIWKQLGAEVTWKNDVEAKIKYNGRTYELNINDCKLYNLMDNIPLFVVAPGNTGLYFKQTEKDIFVDYTSLLIWAHEIEISFILDRDANIVTVKYVLNDINEVSPKQEREIKDFFKNLYGETSKETGLPLLYNVDGSTRIGQDMYYIVNVQQGVAGENDELHHYSTISMFLLSKDMTTLYHCRVDKNEKTIMITSQNQL